MKLKLPWTKRKRGTYRTGKQRVSEQQAKVDAHLLKLYLADLKTHPEFARQVAREKFGLSEPMTGEYTGEPSPDLLDVLRQAKEAKDLIKEEVESEKGSSNTLTAIAEIVKALPTIAQILPQLQAQAGQPAQQPQPKITRKELEQLTEPQPEPEKSPEEAMTLFANHFLELQPEQAALELYQNKDEAGDIRHIIWSYLSENSLDEIMDLIPELISVPEYEFLTPFAQKLSTNKSKRWLALLIDEINKLKTV